MTSESKSGDLLDRLYKYRWAMTAVSVLSVLLLFRFGFGRVSDFTKQVESLADHAPKKSQPQMFDPRSDIWFDSSSPALQTFHEIEERFVAQDVLFIGFEESSDPHGAFSVKSLQAIDRLGKKMREVPYVRNVRSLVANPWIRWGNVDGEEEGLIVSDLFENDPASYTERERLERMISVLGAVNASGLIGEEKVRELLGPDADFSDHIGEPRLLGNLLSEDGRSTAIIVDVIRPRFSDETLDETFGAGTLSREAGPPIHASAVQIEALHAIKELVAEEQGEFDFHITGVPVMREHYMVTAKHDMKFVGLMIVVIAIVLLVLYRRVAGAVLPLITVFLAIMGMLGFVFLKGDLINLVTALTPHMLVAIGVATAVHLVTAYYRLRPDYDDKHDLVRATVRFNLLPVFLTSLTTAVGFMSLTTSVIAPIKQFGYTTAIGTVFAFIISMVLVPTFLSLLPLSTKAKPKAAAKKVSTKPHWSEWLAGVVVRRRKAIVAVGVVLTLLTAAGLYRITLSTDLKTMFGEGNPVVADFLWVDDHISGTGDVEILFSGAPSTDSDDQAAARLGRLGELVNSPGDEFAKELASLKLQEESHQRGQIAVSSEFLGLLDKYQTRLEVEGLDPKSPLHAITSIESALSVLRKIHQVQHENKGTFYRVPADEDVPLDAREPVVLYDEFLEENTIIPGQSASTMIAQYYLQYENGAKPEENLSTLITPDRRKFRFTMRVRTVSSSEKINAYNRMLEIARTEFPGLIGTPADVAAGKALSTMQMTGSNFLQVNMVTAFSETLIASLAIAVLVITLLISLVFRSLIIGIVSMIPNVLPIVVPIGFLSLIGYPLDGPSILVAAVGLGICVDDTIHFLSKYSKARANTGSAEVAIQKTFRDIGPALIYTSIVLACGFAMMTFATFRANVMVGFLGAVIIALAWVADFVLTPAVLSFLPTRDLGKSANRLEDKTSRSNEDNDN